MKIYVEKLSFISPGFPHFEEYDTQVERGPSWYNSSTSLEFKLKYGTEDAKTVIVTMVRELLYQGSAKLFQYI